MKLIKTTAFALVFITLFALAASAQIVFVSNAASGDYSPFNGAVARGSLQTFYVSPPMTNETLNFNPWVEETPGGAFIRLNNCAPERSLKVRILSVHTVGSGLLAYNQFTVYVPNAIGPEIYGACPDPDSFTFENFTFHPKVGFGNEFTKLATRAPFFPGVFSVDGAGASVPSGFHLNATTGAATTFSNCNATPSACPVSTGGVQNYLIFYTTGGEALACREDSDYKCSVEYNTPRFKLNGVGQPVIYYGDSGYLGQEQANVQIRPGTAAGTYSLTITAPPPGYASGRSLTVRLGPAN
ncbi:MAG: hypothetical protein L0Y75_05655 [Acidobacteria bacterium]|nr:hypothetical protein [Acidobacteriota bacterium]